MPNNNNRGGRPNPRRDPLNKVAELGSALISVLGANQAYSSLMPNPKKAQKLLTNGAQTVNAPAAIGFRRVSRAAISKSTSKGGVRVKSSEMIDASIPGSIAFALRNIYAIQPGDKTTFPRLSTEAVLYEQWKAHSIKFEYVPIAPTNTQGSISLSPDYNPTGLHPTSEEIANSFRGTAVGSVWIGNTLNLNCSDMFASGGKKFVRDGNVPGDLKNYDGGRVYVTTIDEVNDTSSIGKLWIHYDIEFFIPVCSQTLYPTAQAGFYLTNFQSVLTIGSYVYLGYNNLWAGFPNWGNLGITNLGGTNATFSLPKGFYCVSAQVSVSTGTGQIISMKAYQAATTTVALVSSWAPVGSSTHHLQCHVYSTGSSVDNGNHFNIVFKNGTATSSIENGTIPGDGTTVMTSIYFSLI